MNLLQRILAFVASVVLIGGLATVGATTVNAAVPCVGTWNIAIGGLAISLNQGTWQSSAYLQANQLVGYHSSDPVSGLNELNRLIFEHRGQCPGDHIKIVAHSEGAAIAHQWVAEHQWFSNANAILLADPKRLAIPGTGPHGLANNPFNFVVGYPLRGVDANFGNFPVETICRWGDVICRDDGNWIGYAITGQHVAYNFNAFFYGNWNRGTVML